MGLPFMEIKGNLDCGDMTSIKIEKPEMIKSKVSKRKRRKHIPHCRRPAEVVKKRNERERKRVNDVNAAFIELSKHLPDNPHHSIHRRSSKINILKNAIAHIDYLNAVLAHGTRMPGQEHGAINYSTDAVYMKHNTQSQISGENEHFVSSSPLRPLQDNYSVPSAHFGHPDPTEVHSPNYGTCLLSPMYSPRDCCVRSESDLQEWRAVINLQSISGKIQNF